MYHLESHHLFLLIISLVSACAFEFVNGFHDTANAVATVIYTNTLKPWVAVITSGIFNFLGVFIGGISVAMGIVKLLPVELLVSQDMSSSLSMVFSLLLSAIIWNLGTWYFGLPSSSSHTLIGSILGVGLAFGLLNHSTDSVNWSKASEIGFSLLISPAFGFGATAILLYVAKQFIKQPEIFQEPDKKKEPPRWIRATLISTCVGVSFFHGSNDGQKGVGLIMLILIGIVPVTFALNPDLDYSKLDKNIVNVQTSLSNLDRTSLNESEKKQLESTLSELETLNKFFKVKSIERLNASEKMEIRKDVLFINKNLGGLLKSKNLKLSETQKDLIENDLVKIRSVTDYAPDWVKIMIAVSLGLGTMIGWKRIVETVGGKIGKTHLTYAQGASAEIVAASTIGLASGLGYPVSTTHVLSSGIAGSMFAEGGLSNINPKTVKNIALAWVLTLPVSIMLSMGLFFLFKTFI